METEASESSDDYWDIEDEKGLKEQLRWCLDDVQHEGSHSASSHYELYPNLGLYVKGLGPMGLTLSDRDARALAALGKQSPFGRGDETVVDESVRKTWELDAAQIGCRIPEWTTFERTMVAQAIKDIGSSGSSIQTSSL